MSNYHTASHPHGGHPDGDATTHPQYGDRLLDDATAYQVYEAQGVVHGWIDQARTQLHHLVDHDTAGLQACQGTMVELAGSVGSICGALSQHTELPLYGVCYDFNRHLYALLDQWQAEFGSGGAAAVQHSGEDFLSTFQHQFDSAFIGL